MLGLGFTLKQDQATTKYTIIETNRNHEKTLTLSKSFLERRAVKEIDRYIICKYVVNNRFITTDHLQYNEL